MKIYLISQNVNTGYDSYDSAVVVAASEVAARHMHPGLGETWPNRSERWDMDWAGDPTGVTAVEIGVPSDPTPRVVCASYNAG